MDMLAPQWRTLKEANALLREPWAQLEQARAALREQGAAWHAGRDDPARARLLKTMRPVQDELRALLEADQASRSAARSSTISPPFAPPLNARNPPLLSTTP